MIRIERTACPAPLDPNDRNAAGPEELRKIKEKLSRGEQVKSGDFSAYSKLEVRDALKEMHFDKCAYCEAPIASVSDTDIEHYRPKKGVTEADDIGVDHPGYWWLAMDWENLVLSCTHCNQARSNQFIIPDHLDTVEEIKRFLVDARRSRSGKANSFPTADNKWCTVPPHESPTHGGPNFQVEDEQPMLINPVDMDPKAHLEWVFHREAAVIRAKDGSPVGEATRKILGLNRSSLESQRRLILAELKLTKSYILEAMQKWQSAETDEQAEREAEVADQHISTLRLKASKERPFTGMVTAFLKEVQAEVLALQQGN